MPKIKPGRGNGRFRHIQLMHDRTHAHWKCPKMGEEQGRGIMGLCTLPLHTMTWNTTPHANCTCKAWTLPSNYLCPLSKMGQSLPTTPLNVFELFPCTFMFCFINIYLVCQCTPALLCTWHAIVWTTSNSMPSSIRAHLWLYYEWHDSSRLHSPAKSSSIPVFLEEIKLIK